MRLSEFLIELGRPVAYYPGLRRLTGSTNATVFLCQFVYWAEKGSDPAGWIFKTSDEIQGEVGLSYEEQVTARKRLVAIGVLQERHDRLHHQMWFRVDLEKLNQEWERLIGRASETVNAGFGKPALPGSGSGESPVGESGDAGFPNAALPGPLNGSSETTSKTTPEITPDNAMPASPAAGRSVAPPRRRSGKQGDLVDGILRFDGAAPDSSDWPAYVRVLGVEFEKLMGRPASKKEFGFWITGLESMVGAGCDPADLRSGWETYHSRKDVIPVKSPATIFTYVDQARRRRLAAGEFLPSIDDALELDDAPAMDPAKAEAIGWFEQAFETAGVHSQSSQDMLALLRDDHVALIRSNGNLVVSGVGPYAALYQNRFAKVLDRGLVGILDKPVSVIFEE